MAQLTEKELKRLAELQDRVNDGVKIQQGTQKELNGLLAKQRKELDTSLKINKTSIFSLTRADVF